MKVFAHRGFSGSYPENTMLAFQMAQEAGADGIELDVQLSKDGQVVIIHDETVDRTTDGSGFVVDLTLKQLKELNASKIKEGPYGPTEIPTLEEYCKWVKDTDLITNIELKTGVYYYRGLEELTLEIVKKYGLEDRVIFSSFNPLSVVKVKELASHIPCGLLTENGGIQKAGSLCKDFGFEYYHPSKDDLTDDNIENCKENGIGLNVWTVNDLDHLERLMKAQVYGIITNYPKTVKKIISCDC